MEWLINFFNKLIFNGTVKPAPAQVPNPAPIELPEEIQEAPASETVTEVVLPAEEITFDKEKFFDTLRTSLFRKGFKPAQVAGIEAVIDNMKHRPTSWIAYALATAYHETNKNMKPNAESINYSVQGLINTFGRHRISIEDANKLGRKPGEGALSASRQKAIANILYGGTWGQANLGNIEAGDGWKFRGRGMDHCTGRRNYRSTGSDIGLDLISNPDLLLELDNSVKSLHLGMVTGRYVSGHNFARYLPPSGLATRQQFRDSRKIINGVDKADLIAGYALDFQVALAAGGHNR